MRSEDEKKALNKRLENAAWGVFLVMLGVFALFPGQLDRQGGGAIVVGLILLGLNAARYYYGLKMSTGTLVLGGLALVSGLGESVGLRDLPLFELFLIGAGVVILWKAVTRRE